MRKIIQIDESEYNELVEKARLNENRLKKRHWSFTKKKVWLKSR